MLITFRPADKRFYMHEIIFNLIYSNKSTNFWNFDQFQVVHIFLNIMMNKLIGLLKSRF